MSLSLLIALQAAPATAAPDASAFAAIDFDLARYRPAGERRDPFGLARRCAGGDADPIVVCGRRPGGGAYPIGDWERIFAVEPLVAEMRLSGNVTADVHAESVTLDRGAVSNRAMVRIRIPF
jgi:hypothetical protein